MPVAVMEECPSSPLLRRADNFKPDQHKCLDAFQPPFALTGTSAAESGVCQLAARPHCDTCRIALPRVRIWLPASESKPTLHLGTPLSARPRLCPNRSQLQGCTATKISGIRTPAFPSVLDKRRISMGLLGSLGLLSLT